MKADDFSPYSTRTRLVAGSIKATALPDGRVKVVVQMFTESPRCHVGEMEMVAADVPDFLARIDGEMALFFDSLAGKSFPMQAN